MSVCSTLPVSSYSSFTRQHLAQPSQRDSHSSRFISASFLRRQNGSSLSLESLSEVFGDVIGRRVRGEMGEVIAVGPHEIEKRRVVHGIVGALAHLLVVDA